MEQSSISAVPKLCMLCNSVLTRQIAVEGLDVHFVKNE